MPPPAGMADTEGEKMSVGERIRAARLEKGWSQPYVAKRTQADVNTIYLHESGMRKPSKLALFGYAMLFGKPVDWFRGNGEPVEMSGSGGETPIELHPIPILGVIIDSMVHQQDGLGDFDVPVTVIQEAPKAFALRAMDHSLAALNIWMGNMIIVDPDGPLVEGRMYVIRRVGEERAGIRRLLRNGPRLTVMDSRGDTISVRPDEVEIAGRVRWAMLEL